MLWVLSISANSPKKKQPDNPAAFFEPKSNKRLFPGHFDIYFRIFLCLNRNLLRALAELFVPYFDGVGTGWDVGQLEVSRFIGDGNIRRRRRDQPAVHPAVHVALNFDDFRLVDLYIEGFFELRHRLVKRAIRLAVGMHVVENPVRVQYLHGRARGKGQDMRMIFTAFLTKLYFRGFDLFTLLNVRDRYNGVRQIAVADDQRRIRLRAFVANFLVLADIELFRRRRCAFELYRSGNAATVFYIAALIGRSEEH